MTQEYVRATERFKAAGIDLNSPLDALRPGYYSVLENVRCYTEGVIQPRQGLTSIASVIAAQTPVHTVRRLNDPNTGNYQRIVATGTKLAYGTGAFTNAQYNAADVAFSGNPVMMVPYRPDQSPSSWMYIADSTAMYKIIGNNSQAIAVGTVHQIGLIPSLSPPSAELAGLVFSGFQNFTAVGTWVGDTVVVLTPSLTAPARINTTTTHVTYDSGATGWCCVSPVSIANMGPGASITLGGSTIESTMIYEVYSGSAATTVASIQYDTDPTNTGTCTIQAAASYKEIRRNALVLLNGATYARVTHVASGPDGTLSFRCTTGAVTIAAGQALVVVASFRTYTSGAMAAGGGDTVVQNCLSTGVLAATGTGWIQNNVAMDFTAITTAGGTNMAVSDEDYVHLSFKCSDLSKITQCRIMLNCDATDLTLAQNYYYRAFTPNDLVAAAKGTQTNLDNRTNIIQRNLTSGTKRPTIRVRGESEDPDIDREPPGQRLRKAPGEDTDPNTPNTDPTPRSQTGTGDNQWSEIRFKRGDLIRVGTDQSRGMANLTGFRLEISGTAGITIQVNSLTVFGSGNPDTGELGSPYLYRQRYRCSTTGARSNWSNTLFEGVAAYRSDITVTLTLPTSQPEVDKIDIQRFGGALTNWTYVGTVSSATSTFTDKYDDLSISFNASISEEDTNYQPWLSRAVPFSTTATKVTGTAIKTSVALPTSLAKGTAILVDGIATTFRRTIAGGANIYEIADSLGSRTNVAVEIPEPLKVGQPLPALWGPYNGYFFACGDTTNPGTLYWSNGNDLDATSETNYLEITASSEPLMNGCVFNGKCYAWSSDRMFEIEQVSQNQFLAIEIPGRKGLVSRWAFAIGERIWYLSRDGIYQTAGGDAVSITDETLRPLFVTEGGAGQAVNGFNPPDFSQTAKLRLSYYNGYLYFNYLDTGAALRTMVYTVRAEKPGWWPDSYLDGRGVTYFYGEEGQIASSLLACGNDAVTGKLYTVSGTADGAGAISSHVRTQYFDGGDRRAQKRWGDFILDADPNSATLTVVAYTDNVTSSTLTLTPTTMTGTGRQQKIIDISSGADPTADYSRNTALDITWASSTATPKLFLWEPSFMVRPETIDQRGTNWDDCGFEGDKFFQGLEIWADTNNVSIPLRVEYDGSTGSLADTLTVQHSGNVMKSYAFRPAFTAHTVRLRPNDNTNNWTPYKVRWYWQPEPALGERWETQPTGFGAEGFVHMKAAYVTIKSTQSVTLTVTRAEDSNVDTYTIPTSSGLKIKTYIPFVARKGKTFSFVMSSTSTTGQFRVYKDESTVYVKPWASEDAFVNRGMWGGPDGQGKVPV